MVEGSMASRKSNRLTARMVEQVKKPGYYGDGGGLVLRVADGGGKVWLFREQDPRQGPRDGSGADP